jgi:hypothetical protein
MIMKRLITLTLLMLAANCVFAQTNADEHEWKATIKVVDEDGAPVPKANVKVGYYTNNTSVDIDGTTDINGMLIVTHSTSTFNYIEYALSFGIEKQGYYGTRSSCDLGIPYDANKWNPNVTILIKKVGKPIAMYAKKFAMALKLPEYGKPIAYDLEIGDWVGPYGEGVNKDIIFQKEYSDKGADGYYSKVTVSFSKEGDGIQIYSVPDIEKGSGLRSPHEAPLDGYQPEVARETSALRGQPSRFEFDPNRIYLFRVRTVKDHDGNIVSAHYGKIYGDFMQFTYYLNPTPNDRNIEFDPKQNLLSGLKSFEQVSAP